MNKLILTVIILFNGAIEAANSGGKVYNRLNKCTPTMATLDNYEPQTFSPSNNLLRRTGEQGRYCGEKVVISGRLLDQNCVPIMDAKVYIWQADCDGRYPYKPLRKRIDEARINLKSRSSFQGSGIATTNNKGEFHFLTIIPNSSRVTPYANIRVVHRDLGSLQTKLYFSTQHLLNAKVIDDISPVIHQYMEDNKIYVFDIVMPTFSTKKY